MSVIVAMLTAIACAGISYITLDKNITDHVRILKRRAGTETEVSRVLSRGTIYALTLGIFFLSFAAALKITTKLSDVINICKMLTALFCLCGAACMDYREYRIPNIFPLVLAVAGILCLAAGYITGQPGGVSYIVSSAFAAVVSVLCLIGASILTNHGIGFGDIKLVGALAISGGVYTIYGTLLYGVLLCAAMAVVLFVTKKKKLQESLPFGPFLLAGYAITIFIFKF